jgi:hypothetical protein
VLRFSHILNFFRDARWGIISKSIASIQQARKLFRTIRSVEINVKVVVVGTDRYGQGP